MPGYKVHIKGALIVYCIMLTLCVAYYVNITYAFSWLISILTGSLFPDIDIKSKIQKIYYRLLFIVLILSLIFEAYIFATIISIVSLTPLLVNHRGVFHKWWFLAFITIAVAQVSIYYFPTYEYIIITNGIFFFIGAISHLWLDLGAIKMFRLK